MTIFSYLNSPAEMLIMIGIRLLIVFTILPVHEYAHAFAAKKMGDNTALMAGRLTLNPIAHVDLFGALFLVLFGFGWAKPVPINPRNFRNYKKGIAITAVAGPLANLICAALGIFVFNVLYVPISRSLVDVFFYIVIAVEYFAMINISLAVFNMIPITPLDGSRLLSTVVSYKVNYFMSKYQQYIYLGFLLLLLTGVLQRPMTWIINLVYSGINLLFFWVEPLMRAIFY